MGSTMKITNDLLKEAIADAERVREIAIANAKIQLEESIAPTIKKEITKALQEGDVDEAHNPHKGQQPNDFAEVGESVETEGEAVEEIANDATSGIGTGDNKAPSKPSSSSSGVGKGGQEWEKFHSGAEGAETPQQMKEEEDVSEDADEVNEGILDLEAIIRELQAEVEELAGGSGSEDDDELDFDGEDEDGLGDEPELDFDAGAEDGEEVEPEPEPELDFDAGDEEEEEDDLDIEEILREIEAEMSEEDNSTVANENARLKGELTEHRKVVGILRSKLNEVNLLNAKLLFTNKLFKNRELTKEQKVHVVETFDLATTLREVKLLYATLSEATIPVKSKKQSTSAQMVTEGIASNVVGSTAPKKELVTENADDAFRKRMQQLAGVKVL